MLKHSPELLSLAWTWCDWHFSLVTGLENHQEEAEDNNNTADYSMVSVARTVGLNLNVITKNKEWRGIIAPNSENKKNPIPIYSFVPLKHPVMQIS